MYVNHELKKNKTATTIKLYRTILRCDNQKICGFYCTPNKNNFMCCDYLFPVNRTSKKGA